jgi:small subunit ribosomal protein S16
LFVDFFSLFTNIPQYMLKIRLQRIGRKNEPHYRVIVTESGRGPKSGKVVEFVGSYNPKMGIVEINAERAKYWLSVGAQASDTVFNMLVSKGVIEAKKRNALPYKKPVVDEEAIKRAEEEAAAKAAAEQKARDDAAAAEQAAKEAEAAAQAEAEAPVETPAEEVPAESPAEEPVAESTEEAPTE